VCHYPRDDLLMISWKWRSRTFPFHRYPEKSEYAPKFRRTRPSGIFIHKRPQLISLIQREHIDVQEPIIGLDDGVSPSIGIPGPSPSRVTDLMTFKFSGSV
jgi:hypothetical protein